MTGSAARYAALAQRVKVITDKWSLDMQLRVSEIATPAATVLDAPVYSTTDYELSGVAEGAALARWTGKTLIETGDIVATFASEGLAITPVAIDHQLVLNGTVYAIVEVIPILPDVSKIVAWQALCRKGGG